MGKGKKRNPSNLNPVIPKNGGMSYKQFSAQQKNIELKQKEEYKERRISGK